MNNRRGEGQEMIELVVIYISLLLIFGFTNFLDKNQFIILIAAVTLVYFLIKKILSIVNKQTIEKFNKRDVSRIIPDEFLTYYTQSFTEELESIQNVKKVNLDEASEILNKFLELRSNNGENYLLGFSKGRNKFWEICMDEDNRIEMVRININNTNIEESNPKDIANIKKSLGVFFKLISE